MAVTVEPPTCYETPVGSIWCFGLVRNLTSTAVEQVTIEVYLVTVNGNPLIQHDAHPAHTVILPDKESPYSVMFDSMPEQAVGSVSVLTNAIPALPETINRFANLSVSNVTYKTRNGVYSGSVTLTNSDATTAQDISIIVTLLNDNRQVTGYWKQHVNQTLNAGQSQQFQFEAIPQGLSTKLVEVSAEAWH